MSDQERISPYSFNMITSRQVMGYIIQQTGSENTETHHVRDITWIKHQILVTNLQGNV